jgi:TolB-like protein
VADVFISYARSTEDQAQAIGEALRALGHRVWRDDELPPHRPYAEVIAERLAAAAAVVVVWSADAVKSHWVQSEADRARLDGKLVQVGLDAAPLPMPFDRIQCIDLGRWSGAADDAGWRKVIAAIDELAARGAAAPDTASPARPSPGEAAPPLSPAKPSLAVMPFADMTGGGDQDWFVDGMMEEITAALARYRSLFVIAGAAALALKGAGLSAQEAARRLGVRYVLEGSVRRGGPRVRIAAKLIDAESGEQIWGERFEDTLEDVFALQDRVALAVAGIIEPTLRDAEIRRLTRRPTASPGAYELYLRAWAMVRTYDWSAMPQAIAMTEEACRRDPGFGQAWSLAARCHYLVYLYAWADDLEPHRRAAVEAGRLAMRAAPEDAGVLGWTAMLQAYLQHDLAAARATADRAVALNAGAAHAWFAAGAVRIITGDLDDAVEHLDRSIRLNPLGADRIGGVLFLSMARFQQRRFEEAAVLASELSQHFDNPTGAAILAASLARLGRPAEAAAALADFTRLSNQGVERFAGLVWPREDQRALFLDAIAAARAGRAAAAD